MSAITSTDPDEVREAHWQQIDAINDMLAKFIARMPGYEFVPKSDLHMFAADLIGHAVRGEPYDHLMPRIRRD